MNRSDIKIRQSSHRYFWSSVTIGIIILLVGITIFNYGRQARSYQANIIAKDIGRLVAIFELIDKDCKIMSFDAQISPINFLNVKSFEGSEVGSMNLAYPTQWKGPYLEQHPEMQDINYQVVVTRKGYFITPGNGVQLPNGKTVGKDLVLTEHSDIAAMMTDKKAFNYQGIALAAPVPLATPALQRLMMENTIATVEDMI